MTAYPVELEEHAVLRDGTEVFLRPVRGEDGPLLQDLLAHMSEEDRRLRFFGPLRRLSETLSFRLTHVDYQHTIALLAFAAETGAILGVVRLGTETDPRRAEFAVALRSDFKGRGLGWLLMQHMLALAARLGVAEVYGYVLHENERMLRMCRELGFTLASDPTEPEAVVARRPTADLVTGA